MGRLSLRTSGCLTVVPSAPGVVKEAALESEVWPSPPAAPDVAPLIPGVVEESRPGSAVRPLAAMPDVLPKVPGVIDEEARLVEAVWPSLAAVPVLKGISWIIP